MIGNSGTSACDFCKINLFFRKCSVWKYVMNFLWVGQICSTTDFCILRIFSYGNKNGKIEKSGNTQCA
jgi:hypothetical protein